MVQYDLDQIIYNSYSNIENYSDISYKRFTSGLYRSVQTYYIFMSFVNNGQFNPLSPNSVQDQFSPYNNPYAVKR